MDGPAAFFLLVLALQLVFTAAVVLIVARRFPARARIYRLIAPAALPLLIFAFVAAGYVRAFGQAGIPLSLGPLGRIALAYLVLWLVGVLWAVLLLRLVRR